MNWALFQNSLAVAGLTAAASVTFGTVAALCALAVARPWRKAILGLSLVAFVLPPFLVTHCWIFLVGENGIWRGWFPIPLYSLGGTVWVLSLLYWPISLWIVFAHWARLEQVQIEIDPAVRGWLLVRWILLPNARPALFTAGILTFVLAFNNFAVPAILQTRVFPAEVWVRYSTNLDAIAALYMSLPLLAVPLILLGAAWAWGSSEFRLGIGIEPKVVRRQLGKSWVVGAGVGALSLILVSAILPISQLVFSARTWSDLSGALAASSQAALNSFWVSAATACTSGVIGLLAWRWRVMAGLWVCFLLPGVFLGIGLILALNRPGFFWIYQSFWIVLLGLSLRYAVLSWLAVRRAMQRIDRDLLDLATLQGASFGQRLRHIYLPQLAPFLAAVWYMTFLLCLWDAETLLLVIPPGMETLSLRIFNLLHYGYTSQINALCLLLLCIALLPGMGWMLWSFVKPVRTRTGFALMMGLVGLLISGCGQLAPDETAIKSQFFGKVQVIGKRGTAPGQFNKPRSLAVDHSDNLYVVDMTGRVQKFSPNGDFILSWQMPETDKGKPKGMGCDRSGNVIVIEPHYARINHFSPDGKLVEQWGERGTNAGRLTLPRSVAVNSQGDILVSEYTVVDRVQIFSAQHKEVVSVIGRPGRGPGEFNRAEGVAVDAQDRIYVADSCNHRVQVFSKDGNLLREYGCAGKGPGQFSYPYDVKVDASGYAFVCEFGNSRIQVFNPEGDPVEILGGAGAAPGQFNNPWAIALDSKGNLYAADALNHRVQKFIRK